MLFILLCYISLQKKHLFTINITLLISLSVILIQQHVSWLSSDHPVSYKVQIVVSQGAGGRIVLQTERSLIDGSVRTLKE